MISPWRTTQRRSTPPTWIAGAQPVLLRRGHRGQPAPLHRPGRAHPGREPGGHQPARHRRRVRLAAAAHGSSASCRSSSRTSRRAATRCTSIPAASAADAALLCNQSYEADPEIAKWLPAPRLPPRAVAGHRPRPAQRDVLARARHAGLRRAHGRVALQPRPGVPQALVDATTRRRPTSMLDKIGLSKKDAEGYRLRTDGKGRLRIELTTYLGLHALHPDRRDDQATSGRRSASRPTWRSWSGAC